MVDFPGLPIATANVLRGLKGSRTFHFRFLTWITCIDPQPARVLGYYDFTVKIDIVRKADNVPAECNFAMTGEPKFTPHKAEDGRFKNVYVKIIKATTFTKAKAEDYIP